MTAMARVMVAALGLGAAAVVGTPVAVQAQACGPNESGVTASLQLKEPVPAGVVYSATPGAMPSLTIVLQLRFCGRDFITVEGTRNADYVRRLLFKHGNVTIANTTEVIAHDAERWCRRVNGVRLSPPLPVFAAEIIPAGTVLEYTLDDARTAYDLQQPDAYSVLASIRLFSASPAALFSGCSGFGSQPLINLFDPDNQEVAVVSNSLEFAIGAGAPTTVLTARAPTPNANGWNSGDVTLSLTATDGGGGGVQSITSVVNGVETVYAGSAATVKITTDGDSTVTWFATNNAGNRETPPPPITVRIDRTPPSLACVLSPPANAAGWNKGPVTVTVSASDGGSGVDQAPGPPVTVQASTSVPGSAVDKAGNRTDITCLVKIDGGAPTVAFGTPTPAPNSAGWNNTNVTIPFTATDADSGIATVVVAPAGAAAASGTVVLSAEGAAVTGTVTVTDRADNTASATSPAVKIDRTPPAVTCSVSPKILWPPNHKLVSVTATVKVTDALSDAGGFKLQSVVSSERDSGLGDGDVPNDIQGFVVGKDSVKGSLRAERAGKGPGRVYTLTYQGLDKAGNAKTCAATVSVPHSEPKDDDRDRDRDDDDRDKVDRDKGKR